MNKDLDSKDITEKNKEIIVIKYYDRIHKKWIDLPVTKEVAKFLESDRKKRQRSRNKYDYFNKQFDNVFMPDKPNNEHFLYDENQDYETIKENKTKQKIEEFEIEHNRVLIENALDNLTPAQKEVVSLTLQNLSQNEISKKLDISKNAVTSRMKKAKKTMKKYIKNTEN